MSKKAKIEIFVGIIITAVIIYFFVGAVSGLNPRQFIRVKINWGLAALSVVLFAFSNYVRALAYTYGNDKNINIMSAFRIIGIGHAANMVLPLHAGEGLRLAFFPGSYSTMERTRLLVVQGISDFIVIFAMALLSVPFTGFKEPLLGTLKTVSLIFSGACLLIILIILCITKLRKYFRGYMTMGVLKMFFWVFLSWIVILVSIWIGFIAFGFHPQKSIRLSLSVFSATNIINFVPASPGGIGLFEYGVVLGLGGLGIPKEPAIVIGIFLHLIQYAALMPLGAVLYFTSFKNKNGQGSKKSLRSNSRRGSILKK